MAISKFKITNSPSVLIPRMGTNFLIIDNLYNLSEEQNLNFQRIAELEGYFLNKKVKYKTYDPVLDKYSNEAEINLVWKEQNLAIIPASADNTVLLENSQTINFLDYLPINSAVEFIQVHEITEVLQPAVINDDQGFRELIPENRFSPEDLLNSTFKIKSQGGGTPYYIFKYKVGRGSILEPTIYTFQINVAATVAMALISQTVTGPILLTNVSGTETSLMSEVSQIEISGGPPFGTVKLSFDLSNLLPAIANSTDRLVISINGQNITKTDSSSIFEIIGDFDTNGKLNFQTEYLKDSTAPVSNGSFVVTVLETNGSPLAVSITSTIPSTL